MPQVRINRPTPSPESTGSLPKVRSLPVEQWPEADRAAWTAACRPTERLRRGGAASHLKAVTRRDLARRYGYFLDYVERSGGLDRNAEAASYVTLDRVERFLSELQVRVRSVTVYGTIYKVRRTAQLLAPVEISPGSARSRKISHS